MPGSFRSVKEKLRSLLELAVHRVTTQIWIVLLLLEALWVRLSVFRSRVARWRLTLFAGFSALESDDFYFSLFSHATPTIR